MAHDVGQLERSLGRRHAEHRNRLSAAPSTYFPMSPPFSERTRYVERIRQAAPDRLEPQMTIEDPETLERARVLTERLLPKIGCREWVDCALSPVLGKVANPDSVKRIRDPKRRRLARTKFPLASARF